jgi:peptidoglycan/LPS O-acetylase OafA/YrhL
MLLLAMITTGSRFLSAEPWMRYAVAGAASVAAILGGGLLWLFVERPLLLWSRRFCR